MGKENRVEEIGRREKAQRKAKGRSTRFSIYSFEKATSHGSWKDT